MKKIAIVGAGLAGLATAWQLIAHHQITLFDAKGIGGGASGIAAGLVHPYVGEQAKRSVDAHLALDSTIELLNIASNTLGHSVYLRSGVLRLALNDQQKKDFFICSQKYPDVEWQNPSAPYPYPGILIKTGLQVDCPQYLNGLFLACQAKGLNFTQKKIDCLSQLDHFDLVILTTGAETLLCPTLPIHPVKGQVLTLKWPKNLAKPSRPINSKSYLIVQENNTCLLGATFEHTFSSPLPDIETAKNDLLPKINLVYPELNEVTGCSAALRASTPSRKPMICPLSPKCWLYAGLGSKGLLYHAFYAKKLKEKIG